MGQKFEGWFLSSFSSNAVNLFYKGFTFVVPLNEKGTRVMIGQKLLKARRNAKFDHIWNDSKLPLLRTLPPPRNGGETT